MSVVIISDDEDDSYPGYPADDSSESKGSVSDIGGPMVTNMHILSVIDTVHTSVVGTDTL